MRLFFKKQNKAKKASSRHFGHFSDERAFTLIETFVAVTILMSAVVGPLTIAQRSLSSSYYTRDRITAYYLAQDAIEFLRTVRDNASLGVLPAAGPTGWDTFLSFVAPCVLSGPSSVACKFDSSKISYSALASGPAVPGQSGISTCLLGVCEVMNYSTLTGLYNYEPTDANNRPSPFTRTITITPLNVGTGNNEVRVRVTMTWRSAVFGNLPRTFTIQDTFHDWQ